MIYLFLPNPMVSANSVQISIEICERLHRQTMQVCICTDLYNAQIMIYRMSHVNRSCASQPAQPSSSGIAAQSMTAAVSHKSHNPLHGLTSALRRRVSLHAAASPGPKTPQPLHMPAEDASAAGVHSHSALLSL